MAQVTEKELLEARKRFYALAGLPMPEQEKVADPYMEAWKTRGAGDATQAFIEMNAKRVAQGLPPLGANGQPVESKKLTPPPPLPIMPTAGEDDFFSQPSSGEKIAKRDV